MFSNPSSSGISKGALAGIVLGAIAVAVTLSAIVSLLILKGRMKKYYAISRRRQCEYLLFSFSFFFKKKILVRCLLICDDIENSDVHYNLLGARAQI